MNNIYKVIWNHATQTWTAVGELASAKGKSKSIKLAVISTALFGSATGVQAATTTAADKLIAMSVELPASATTTPQTLEAKATGKDSIAIGVKAEAGANSSIERTIALGYEAQAGTNDSVAIGSGAQVVKATPSTGNTRNARGIAIGSQARIEPKLDGFTVSNGNDDAIAIGTRAIATSGRSIVMGLDASSMRNHNAATHQSGEYTIAIGNNASSDWRRSIAIGNYAKTFHEDGIAIGNHVTAAGWENRGAVAIGTQTNAMSFNSIAVGQMTNAKGEGSVAIGREANSHGTNSVSLGISSYTPGNNAIAIGGYAFSGQDRTQRTIAIGDNAHSVWDDNLSLGHNAFSGGNRSNSIGREAVSHGWQALAIGSSEPGGPPSAMAMGDNAASIGTGAFATGWGSIAFGNQAKAGATTDEDINTIKASYNTYRSAYDAYIKADKALNDKTDNYNVVRTRLSQYATNLKILTGKYYVGQTSTIDGVLAKHRDAFIKALEQAGSSYNELTALADKFEKEPNADKNVAAAKAQRTVIEKFAAIDNTGPGEANEKLAHLVALAKNLKAQLDEEAKLEEGVNTAQRDQAGKKAAFTTAEAEFKAKYAKNGGIAKQNALAIGNSSIANSDSSTAVGHQAKVSGTSPKAVAIGFNARAGESGKITREGAGRYFTTNAPNATVVGSGSLVALENSTAVGYDNIVRAKNAGAFGTKNRIGEWDYEITGADKALATPKEGQTGENSFVVGSNNGVWAKNVMVLGNNVRVYGIGRRSENRENAVVLGNNSDGEPTVKKVNSANVNGMVYSGFKGNLGATKTDGSEAEKADLALQGRFVSIGAPTKKIDKTITIADGKTNTTTVTTNLITGEVSTDEKSANTKGSDVAGTSTETVYGERQIKHVAAGEISSTSTDAINGSQLYAVASGLRDAFPVVYTDKDGKKLVKYPDGNYYPEGTVNINGKYYPAGTTADNVTDATEEVTPVTATNVIASMNNPSSDAANAGGNVTLTNVAPGANTYEFDKDGNPLVKIGDKYYAQGDVENGAPKKGAQEATPATDDQKDPYEKAATGLANLDGSKNSNALTVADAKNLGWVVSATGNDYANSVQNAHQVNFVGVGNVDVDGDNKDGVRTLSISVDSPIDYASTKAIVDGAEIDVVKANDGKWYPKDQVDEEGNPKENAKSVPADSIVKKGAVLSDSDAENNPYRNESAYTYQTDNAGNITIAPKTYADLSKENGYNKDEIKPGTGGVQLGNVGWATNPDQAVNKDQLDQTVNKSGFFVQQNGKTTVENATNKGETDPAKSEKVTPNDVVNFVNGNGTVIKAVTTRNETTGVDTTTVSVDVDNTTMSNSFPVVYTDINGKKLRKEGNNYYPADAVNINGKWYPTGTTEANAANATEIMPVTNVIASMNNPSSDAVNAGGNVTLTNVAQGANTIAYDAAGNPLVKVGDSYYAPDQFENGKLKANATPTPSEKVSDATDPVKKAKTGLADLENSVAYNALTVADAKNLGWVVSADSKDGKGYAEKVTNANEVRFNGTDGIKVTGETKDGVRHINISLEKGAVVKQDEYTIEGKTYVSIDGKLYNKEDVDFSGDKPKAKDGKQPSSYIVKDSKVINNTTPDNPVEVKDAGNGSNFVDGNTVYKAIQESGWTVGKVKNALADSKFQNADEKVNPSDEVRFADGKGITVKTATVDEVNTKGEKQTTTVVKFDTDLPINYANVKNSAGDNLKQANDGNWYKEADVNNDGTVKLTNNKAPEAQTPVKTGATLSDANSNMGNPYRTAIEDKAMAAAIKKVRGENPTATAKQLLPKVLEEAAKQAAELEKAEKAGQDKDVINPGKDGVQLNNVGWAENPDQAVNKDQLDQTVNKSGFFVKQNGKTTVENAENKEETDPAKYEKVTPNDVVNFVNGKGTVIKAVTKRDAATGVDTTTVSVDVDTSTLSLPKGANTIAYNNDGKQIVNVDGKYYKAGDLTNGKPNTGAVEQTPVTPATDKSVDQAKNGLIDLNNSNGGNAITISDAKNLGWVVSTSDNNVATAVKNADVVDFKAEAGTGLTVKGKSENGKMTVTVGNDYIKANATGEAAKATAPNSVAIGGNSNAAVEDAVAIGNGATVGAEATKGSVAIGAGAKAGKANVGSYSIDPSATVAGKTGPDTRVVSVGDKGNEAQIQNVAPGVISATSTDAVNGSQLHATNVQVNNNAQNINRVEGKVDNLSQVINNHAGEFNRLDRKVNKYGKEARAGIAGANAAAALPQVYTPGKSMVAASAGTFKGQNALAVGYSRASDNGKVILKLQGNANTSGDIGAGVGVGYQW